jgi:hypothetical protein
LRKSTALTVATIIGFRTLKVPLPGHEAGVHGTGVLHVLSFKKEKDARAAERSCITLLARLAAELDADAAGAASGAVPDAALLSDGSHRTFTVHSDTGFGGGL